MNTKTIRHIIQVIRILLTLAVMVGLLYIGWWIGNTDRLTGNIVMALTLLITGWSIITLTHRLMQRNRWKMIGFTALYLAAVWVYEGALEENRVVDILAPVNNTLSIFFPSRGSYSDTFSDTVPFHVIHLLSYLFFAMIGFSWFGRRLLNRAGCYLIPSCVKNVFWGYSEGSVLLAKDMLKQTIWQQVVFVLPPHLEKNEELFELLDDIGAAVIYQDLDATSRIPRAYRHFFLTDDTDQNVKVALKVFAKVHLQKKERHLYVNSNMVDISKLFNDYEETTTNVHIINPAEITARELMRNHHPLDMPGIQIDPQKALVQGSFNILQLGFGETGREVLNKMICNTQYVGSQFKATICDQDLNTKHGAYHLLYRYCVEQYHLDINSINSEVGSEAFYDWMNAHIGEYNRIIIALGSDALNIDVALTLARIMKNKAIPTHKGLSTHDYLFVHVRDVDKYSYYKNPKSPIQLFGDWGEIYSYGVIVNEELDTLAKEMNWDWADSKHTLYKNAEEPWRLANIFSQDSSRSSAEGITNTLKLIGMFYGINQQATPISDEQFNATIEPILEVLAENEHLRWNAFHFTRGVLVWDYTRIAEEDFLSYKCKANQVAQFNKHAALIPYKELPLLDERLNAYIKKWNSLHSEEKPKELLHNQENDRNFVRDIPRFVAQIKCSIQK